MQNAKNERDKRIANERARALQNLLILVQQDINRRQPNTNYGYNNRTGKDSRISNIPIDSNSRNKESVQGNKKSFLESGQSELERTRGARDTALEQSKGKGWEAFKTSAPYKYLGYGTANIAETAVWTMVVETPIGIYAFVKNPKEGIKGTWAKVVNYKETAKGIKQEFAIDPTTFLAKSAGAIAFGEVGGELVGKVGTTARNTYVRVGAKYVPAEDVFAKDVLSGAEKYARTSGNIKDTHDIRTFKSAREGDQLVGTSSMDFTPRRNTIIESGNKGVIEDKGLWITPEGRTNVAYLKIGKNYGEKQWTLNPFKGKSPNILRVKYKDVQEIPTNVQRKALTILRNSGKKEAVNYINNFYKTEAKKGVAYIPFKSIMGNNELQALIPNGNYYVSDVSGTIGKIKGYNKYTSYENRNIPIRDIKVEYETNPMKIEEIEKNPTKQIITKEEIAKLQQESYDYYSSPKYETPYKYLSYTPKTGYNDYMMYKPSYPQSPYPTPYMDYGNYGNPQPPSPRENYGYGNRYNPKSSQETQYTPYPVKEIKYPIKEMPYPQKQGRMVQAWRPIMQDEEGNTVFGNFFETREQAINEGEIAVDNSKAVRFKLQKQFVPINMIKPGRDARIYSKFMQKGDTFYEKSQFLTGRNARPAKTRKGINVMPFVYGYN